MHARCERAVTESANEPPRRIHHRNARVSCGGRREQDAHRTRGGIRGQLRACEPTDCALRRHEALPQTRVKNRLTAAETDAPALIQAFVELDALWAEGELSADPSVVRVMLGQEQRGAA